MKFRRATKAQAHARVALIGPSGSGKTYTALLFAQTLGERVALIDTEHGSASKYADEFVFDVLELDDFAPKAYVEAIEAAGAAGYDVLIIDSLSHAWAGKGGALEMVDNAAARPGVNKYTAWRDVTPWHNRLIDTIISSPCHVIATMRAKTEYVIEKDDKGATTVRKVGLAPVQRDGMEYEFDITADMDANNTLMVSKTRCPALRQATVRLPGRETAQIINDWLTDGVPVPEAAPAPTYGSAQRMVIDPGPAAPFAGEVKARVIAAQKSIAAEFGLPAAELVTMTKTYLPTGKTKLDELDAEEAETLISALAEWAAAQEANRIRKEALDAEAAEATAQPATAGEAE